eukprot:1669896-Alexandrium_andersonii.AAC.1
MSASLVGSEMCIRDRCLGGPRAPRLGRRRPWPGRQAAVAQGGGRRPPVSYTHLTLPTICSV